MTVAELISQYDEERPNSVKEHIKIRWVEEVERSVMQDVILTHHPLPKALIEFARAKEEEVGVIFFGKRRPHFEPEEYFQDWNDDREVLIEKPYEQVYKDFLDMKTALMNNEWQRRDAAAQMFNANYLAYQQHYNRTHKPNEVRPNFLDHTKL